jgi:rhodanese-related sulfurtransferase
MEATDAAATLDSMQVVDVREHYEWAAGHLRDATHIPLQQLPKRFEEIDPDQPVLMVCQIGQRSALACASAVTTHTTSRVASRRGRGQDILWSPTPVVKARS